MLTVRRQTSMHAVHQRSTEVPAAPLVSGSRRTASTGKPCLPQKCCRKQSVQSLVQSSTCKHRTQPQQQPALWTQPRLARLAVSTLPCLVTGGHGQCWRTHRRPHSDLSRVLQRTSTFSTARDAGETTDPPVFYCIEDPDWGAAPHQAVPPPVSFSRPVSALPLYRLC